MAAEAVTFAWIRLGFQAISSMTDTPFTPQTIELFGSFHPAIKSKTGLFNQGEIDPCIIERVEVKSFKRSVV